MLEAVRRRGVAARGRTSFGVRRLGRGRRRAAFAARHGFEPKSAAVNRRQVLADVDFAERGPVGTTRRSALAADYELVRRAGATPADELDGGRRDDRGDQRRTHRRPRHRGRGLPARADPRLRGRPGGARPPPATGSSPGTGRPASSPGHTVVVVDGERPELGRAARHLGASPPPRPPARPAAQGRHEPCWLRDVEPQLESIDTWNAESNDHMIGVNELLGYRVMGREIGVPDQPL